MRKYMTIAALVCAIALVMTTVLTGCGEQQQDAEMEMPVDPAAPDPAEAPADDATGEEVSGDVEELADIMAKWPESFVMTATTEDKSTGETTTATASMMIGDQKPVKIKAEVPEGTFIADYEENVMYTWETGGDTAMKIGMGQMQESMENPYAELDPDTKITGSETIDGVDCWVVETTDNDGATVTSWVAKDNGLVQKMESDKAIVTYEYDRVGSVPASEFEVPEGMEIQEMPEMGEMPQMPEGAPGR